MKQGIFVFTFAIALLFVAWSATNRPERLCSAKSAAATNAEKMGGTKKTAVPLADKNGFCPDPLNTNFNALGCGNTFSKTACESSVSDGWYADDAKCTGSVKSRRLGESDCMVGAKDICMTPLVCTPDPIVTVDGKTLIRNKCVHPYGSRDIGQSCSPFGVGGAEHHACSRGYCKKQGDGASYKCALYDWGYSHSADTVTNGCRANKDCVEGYTCSTNGVCYKPSGSVGTGDSCRVHFECASSRCKLNGGAVGYCEPAGQTPPGNKCDHSAECSTGCCNSNVCSARNSCK